MTPRPALLVFVGGCAGGAVRLAADALVPAAGGVPWEILAINVIGSFLLGLVSARTLVRGVRWWTPLATTGMLGGFTTFSAVAALPWTNGTSVALGAAVLAATMVAAVLAAAAGFRLGSRDPGEVTA